MNSNPPALLSLKAPGTESMAVDCLELDQYHWTCVKSLASRCVVLPPASGTTNLASLIYRPSGSQSQQSVQLASIPKLETCLDDCSDSDIYGVVMQNGWVRYHFHEGLPVLPALFWFGSWNGFNEQDCESWLSQANHIFSRLQITTHLEDYGVVTEVEYRIHIPPKDLPAGYLFLCPTADFKTGPSSFRWPECPAYWSLDATGIERLSTEEANRLGFPSIQLETLIFLASWDAGVYAGLRQFHQAKGFDPDSQNVARHLGHQLFQFTNDDDWNLGFTDPGSVGCNDIEPSAKEESQLTKIVQDESPAVSLAFNFIIGLQLALILLAWLCAAMFNGVSE
ncbi:hypothetical protein C8R47DRAFT_3663 [Mycena vitilis]|nr:hypothetical protein C8R47DRAFT_3663 [Mycena vitilis]